MKSLMTIDIAHPPQSGADAEEMLDEALKTVRLSKTLRVLKIIHGYGSRGSGGTLKTVVQNWVHTNKHKLILSIDGKDLSASNSNVQVMVAECDFSSTADFLSPNEGVTIVWIT